MRWMQYSSGEEDCGCAGCKVLAEKKTADAMDTRFEGIGRLRMRWMHGSRGEKDCGCAGCKVLGERKSADAMHAIY